MECLLDQPSENRAETKKQLFIKDRQETLDNVFAFLANVFVFSHFWVRMGIDETTSYPFVVQLLVEVADILSSVEYRKFTGKFVGGYENMSHTLIAYVFKILSLFVKAAKTPVVTRHTKACNVLEMKHFKMMIMIQRRHVSSLLFSFHFFFLCNYSLLFPSLLE